MEKIFNATNTIIGGKLYYDKNNKLLKLFGDRYLSVDDISDYKIYGEHRNTSQLIFKVNGKWNHDYDIYFPTLSPMGKIELTFIFDFILYKGKGFETLKNQGRFTNTNSKVLHKWREVEKRFSPDTTPTPPTSNPKTFEKPDSFAELKENPWMIPFGIIGGIILLILFILV